MIDEHQKNGTGASKKCDDDSGKTDIKLYWYRSWFYYSTPKYLKEMTHVYFIPLAIATVTVPFIKSTCFQNSKFLSIRWSMLLNIDKISR